jgi:hypothetical protein
MSEPIANQITKGLTEALLLAEVERCARIAETEVDILLSEYCDQNEHGHMSDQNYRRAISVLSVVKQRITHSLLPPSEAPPVEMEKTQERVA